MNINKYNRFLIESTLYELIKESKLVYEKNFKEIIKELRDHKDNSVSKVAEFLYKICGEDIDKLLQNYIDVSKDSDKVSFLSDDKIKNNGLKINSNAVLSTDNQNIIDRLKISTEGLLYGPILNWDSPMKFKNFDGPVINSWKIIEKYNSLPTYEDFIFYLIQNIENPKYYTVVYDMKSDIKVLLPSTENITRNTIRIGRFINKIMDIYFENKTIKEFFYFGGTKEYKRSDFTASDIEKFVNAYSSEIIFQNNAYDSFEIVSGDVIKYWYLQDNYATNLGQLGSSCMRYAGCQNFFSIYTDNKDVCQLLILKDTLNKLVGRALLWTDVNGKKWIDRVYTSKDNYTNLFKKWSQDNNYSDIHHHSNKTEIKISAGHYELYPYMDTFQYYKIDEGILYTETPERPFIILSETNGGFDNRGYLRNDMGI